MSFPKRLPGGLPAGSTTPIKVWKPAFSADAIARILDCGWDGKAILRLIRKAKLSRYQGKIWMSHLKNGWGQSAGLPELHAAIMAKIRKLESGDDSPLERDDLEDDAA